MGPSGVDLYWLPLGAGAQVFGGAIGSARLASTGVVMRPLVIGIGHSDRSDDHVGIEVVRLVAETGRDVDVLAWSAPPLLLLDHWQGRHVVVVDAMRSGRHPGSVAVLDESMITPGAWFVSSHDMGIAQAFVLARTMGLGPASLAVVGVEIARHHIGHRMAREVADAVPIALAQVLVCLDSLARVDTPPETSTDMSAQL